MNIELKGISYNPRLSEETNAFSASIYIDGKKAGIASNRGNGGATDYYPVNQEGKELISKAEEFCKKLPAEKFEINGEERSYPMNLEHFIDKLIDKHLNDKELIKFNSKLENAIQKSIVIGIPDHSFRPFPSKMPFAMLLGNETGQKTLAAIIQKQVLPKMRPDEKILNTNIPEAVFKAAGLTDAQYNKVSAEEAAKKSQQKASAVKKQSKGKSL